jgi:hypothetical protein
MGSFEDNQNVSFLGTKNALNKPVVEQRQEYIGIFKGVGSSSPLEIGNSSYFLTYLVDATGKVNKISDDSVYLFDANSNFGDNPNVVVRVDQPTQLNNSLSGEHKVTSIGSLAPIVYTQTGSERLSNVNSLSFLPPGVELIEGAANYIGQMDRTVNYTIVDLLYNGSKYYVRNFTDIQTQPDSGAATFDKGTTLTSTGSYTVANPLPTPDVLSSFTIRGQVILQSNGNLGLSVGESGQFSLFLYRKRGSTHTLLKTAQGIITRPDLSGLVLTEGGGSVGGAASESTYYSTNLLIEQQITRENLEAGDEFYLRLDKDGGNIFNVQSYYQNLSVISQVPSTGQPYLFGDQNPKGYWETGSSQILTSSQYLGTQYRNIQQTVTSSEDFGFPPISEVFEVKVGDKIRFEYNKENTFTIYNVTPPSSPLSSGSRVYLTLNEPVPPNINTNNFVIYRNKIDGKYVTLDVTKNELENTEFTGIIIPQYPSEELSNNIESILTQLKQDGIIEE